MTIESDLRLIHSDLISDEPGSSECKEAIQRLRVNLGIKDPNQISQLLPLIFNECFGIIKCITEGISRKARITLIKPLVKWLSQLADNFAHLLAEYADKIMILCCKLDCGTLAIQGCEIFIAIVKNAPWIFHNVREIFMLYQQRLHKLNSRMDGLKTIPFFEAVELMIEKYPEQLNVHYFGLWQMIVVKLCQIGGEESHSLILPCSKLLFKLKIHFTPNDEQCTSLYKFFLTQIGAASQPSCSIYDAILPFFTEMMQCFGKNLLEDCELWHGHFLKHVEKKLEMSPDTTDFDYTMKYPIDEFYRNIFSLKALELTNMNEYFRCYLYSRLESQSLNFYDANCLILWSGRSHTFLSLDMTEQFLGSLVHFIFSTLRGSGTHKKYLISICIESVCVLIGKSTSLFGKYQQLTINLMDSLSSQDLGGNDYVVHSLQVCLLNIPSTADHILRTFVYRNMLKHCSLKWPACSQQRLNNNCKAKLCTGCSHSQFWKKLLDIEFFFKCQINGLLGYSKSDVEATIRAVWNSIIEFVFYLSSTLNFSLCKNNDPKNDGVVKISSISGFLAASSGDITLHSNVVQLLCCIVDEIPSSVWMEWNHIFLLETSLLSASYPYISGFCRLVMMGLKLHEKIENSWVDSDSTTSTLKQFFLNCLYHCQVYGGELQLSYVHLLLNIPAKYVVGFADQLLSFFQVVFELSKNDFHLAVCALSTIRRWMVCLGKDALEPFISTVVPLLVPLIRVQLGTEGKLKKERTSESYAVLREILILLAYMDSSLLEYFYSGFQYNLSRSRKLLNFKLSTNDLSLNINLDLLLPQVFFLSTHSSNFQERLRSCELLHLIGCYMLGKGSQVEDIEQNPFSELFKRVISLCLDLAHDAQPMVKQIFNPFIMQCTNLFSFKLSVKELSKAFTESLLDYMMQPRSEVCLGVCCGYITNLLKTGNTDSDQLCQTNLELIVNNASQNLLHPCLVRRKGAALALLSIRQILFTETWSYDKYCLYMIYLAISNLIIFHEGCDHILEILKVIRKAVGTHHHVLHKYSESRISPPGFTSIELKDMVSWLNLQAVSSNTLVTSECCSLLTSLAPCFPGIPDSRAMITSFTIQYFTEQSFVAFSDLVDKVETSELNELLKSSKVTCHIIFFSWLIENCDTQFLSIRNWIFIKVVGSLLKKMRTKRANQNPTHYPLNIWEICTNFKNHLQEEFVIFVVELIAKLENSGTSPAVEALELLNNFTNLTSFLHIFLIEPSTLEVRFETQSYRSLCEDRLKIVCSSSKSSHAFMIDTFVKIDELLKDLPDVLHSSKQLHRSHLELFHCVGLLNGGSLSEQIYYLDMKKMMKQLSDAFVCGVSCDHRFAHFHRRPLSKLFNFILSLGTFDEVCSELFNSIFSDPTKAINFYEQFEHDILKYIIGGINEQQWPCFGDISCNVKMKIINKILSKCNSFASTNKFAVCVMKSFTMNWQNIVSSVKVGSDLYILMDCLHHIGNSLTPECFCGTEIELWMRDKFQEDLSSHLLLLLVPYMDPSVCSDLIADIGKKEEAILFILSHSIIVGHFQVVSVCLKNLSENHLKLTEAYDLIASQFINFDPVSQGLVLNQMFQNSLRGKRATIEFHQEVLSRLVTCSTVPAQKKFFSDNTATITGTIFKELAPSSDIVTHEELLNHKSVCFLLIGIMYGTFDKNEMFGQNGFVIKSSGNKACDTLRLDVIKSCYKLQSSKLLETSGDSSYVESWRICQCSALNCLLVLLCSTTLSSKALQHFVFQDKTERTPNPIIETIVDSNAAPKFISWQEVKQIKNKRNKVVDTGIKIARMSSNFDCHTSYLDVSITSISQECKAFDFIRRADIPPLRNSTSVVEVDLEGDTLSSHVCLPYLYSTINKTVECGITSSCVGEKMPEWMASFNSLLRNPEVSQNVKTFIVKIVHKCKDIFKPYAAYWTPPILYSLVSLECCGEVTSYFFYQATTMLISWVPLCDQNQENGMIAKLWNRLVEKIIAGVAACISEDITHLLRILRLIIEHKRVTSPPYSMLMELVNKKSTHILGVTLKVCCILFENGYPPYISGTQETFLCSIKSVLTSKEMSENAAVLVGYILKNASSSTLQQTYSEMIVEELNKLELSRKGGEFFALLKNICRNFPLMAERFLPVALSHLNNPKLRTLHRDIMDMIESYVSSFPNTDVFFNLKKNKFFDFLVSNYSTTGPRLCGLNILKSFIGSGSVDMLNFIVRYVIDHSREFSSLNLKTQVYDIVIVASGSLRSTADASDSNLALELEGWLFKHLLEESNADLQEQLIRCIINDLTWKSNTRELMMKLLEALPNVSINRNISTCFVNTLLLKSLISYGMEDSMCDELTVGTDIEGSLRSIEPVVIGSSLAPLFVETIPDESIVNPSDDGGVRLSEYIVTQASGFQVHSGHSDTNKMITREIKYMRSYGNKKLPDVRITFTEAILILQTLCKVNKRISGAIFSSSFSSVLDIKLDHRFVQRLKILIPVLLKKLVTRSAPDPTFVLPLLDVCWKYCVTLEPDLLYDVCKICNTREIGVLLAEQNISPLVPSSHCSFREPNRIAFSDYNYILSMFHEDLGHIDVSTSFSKMTPNAVISSSDSSCTVESMQTIFSQNMKFKELALLNDWDQLNLELKKPDMSESSCQWDNRCFRRFLDYRILSEINGKMLRIDASSTGSILEWMEKHKKYRDVFEWELGDDLNMQFLLYNRLDDFKIKSALSAINWTYFMGLDRRASPIHHRVKLKKSLDNYVMAISLDEPDGSSYFNQLQIDALYYPENLTQWHQLIINRDYFLSFIDEKLESPFNQGKSRVLIRKLQSDYLKYLISNGNVILVKQFASAIHKDTSDSSHKNDFVENSMIHLLESKNHLDLQLKLDCLWKSWNSLTQDKCFDNQDVTVLLHLASLCSEFIFCMKTCTELEHERLKKAITAVSSNVAHLPLNEALIHCGHESVSRACEYTDRSMMADVLGVTADFCLKHLEDASSGLLDQLNETAVKCILKSLALRNSYGHHMFLKALNIVLNNNHTVSVFQNESLKIDLSSFAFWLPQIVGYINSEKAHILEPLLMKLAEKCPQKLWLILHLYQSERMDANWIVKKILQNLGSQLAGKKLIDALGSVCHPNLLLRSYVNRLMKSQDEENILKLYSEIKENCFFNPHQGMMVGRIFMINDQYKKMIDIIFEKKMQSYQFSDEEIKKAVGTVEIQQLDRYLRLESFSPVLSTFNCNTFTFEIPHTNCNEQNSCSNLITLASFSPNVTVIQSLRKPIKIEMLGSDGISYPWIVKFDEDLRQDQYIQQLFTIINHSMMRQKDWTKENIISYKVVPFTPQFGIIEMVNPAVTMSSLINTAGDGLANLRNSLKDKHSNWIHQALREAPRENATTAYAHAAEFYSVDDILSSFSTKSKLVPKDLLRTCLLKYCDSPMDYFHRRLNFLRSHAVLSLCHWVTGVGDRHLNNFLFSTKTCELIGIDFGFSFGAGLERLPVPELVPFRLTPQFFGAYIPLYKSGIMEDIMVKCFSSIDKDIILLAMQVLVQLPLYDMHKNIQEYNTKGTAVDHARWIIESVQRKLAMENPLDVVCKHLNYGRLDQHTVNIYCSVLQRFSHFSKAASPHGLVKMLIEMASDEVLLGISYHNFEPWI